MTIFYYTGTGNSLWVARELAKKLGDEALHFIPQVEDVASMDLSNVGFVFPVYIWGVPAPVLEFIESIPNFNPEYCFAIATNGGQVANTLVQLRKFMKTKNVKLNAAFQLKTPSNYIPWGGPCGEEEQKKLFSDAEKKLDRIVDVIKKGENRPVEKGALWQNILFSGFYKMSKNHVHQMDGKFWVDDKCNGCKICEQVCPSNNIMMINGEPSWNQKCHQCYACLQWCPQEAIQYGKKTPKYKRYHHPDISLKDILNPE